MPINIPAITIPFTLNGYRSYLCAGAIIILAVLHAAGYVPDYWYDLSITLIGGGGLAAIRSAVKKSGPEPIKAAVEASVIDGIQKAVTDTVAALCPATKPEVLKPAGPVGSPQG